VLREGRKAGREFRKLTPIRDAFVKPLADCKLYTFVDTAYLHGRAPEAVAQQLCDAGSDLIQLRGENSAGVGFVINDHLEIARAMA